MDYVHIDLGAYHTRDPANLSGHTTIHRSSRSTAQDRGEYAATVHDSLQQISGRSYPSSETIVRGRLEVSLAHELLGHQWVCEDLVSHAFGDTVPVTLVARILLVFLHYEVLQVSEEVEGGKCERLNRGQWIDACLHSAVLLGVKPISSDDLQSESIQPSQTVYRWSWAKGLRTNQESNTNEFFNVVGTFAYLAACALNDDFEKDHPLRNRFGSTLRVHHVSPLSHQDQDARPGIYGLPCSAFSKKPDANRLSDFFKIISPITSIIKHFPAVFVHKPLVPQANVEDGPMPSYTPPFSPLESPVERVSGPSLVGECTLPVASAGDNHLN